MVNVWAWGKVSQVFSSQKVQSQSHWCSSISRKNSWARNLKSKLANLKLFVENKNVLKTLKAPLAPEHETIPYEKQLASSKPAEVHPFSHFSLFRHLKFTQNFIWQLDRDGAGVRERDGHLTGGDRPRSQRKRERERGWGGEEGWRDDEAERQMETRLSLSLPGETNRRSVIWAGKEKEMEIRERRREGMQRNAKWGEDGISFLKP